MNQKTILAAVGVLIIAILAIWYFTSTQKPASTAEQTATTTTSDTSKTGTAAGSNTFHSIFTQSGNHECTYAQLSGSSQANSVVYIADGKMRGEFRTTSGGNPEANLMVYTGGYLYSWKEGASAGKKTSIKSIADLPSAIPQDLTGGAIFGISTDNVSWDCHNWNKDATLLTVPTYVTFSS